MVSYIAEIVHKPEIQNNNDFKIFRIWDEELNKTHNLGNLVNQIYYGTY